MHYIEVYFCQQSEFGVRPECSITQICTLILCNFVSILEQEVLESLTQDQFTSEFTFRHGFPHKPTALAFDPLQRIMAIGNRSGAGMNISHEIENFSGIVSKISKVFQI